MNRSVRPGLAVVASCLMLLTAAGCRSAACGSGPHRAGQCGSSPKDAVVFEAVGFAAMPPGTDLQTAHRRALLDARRNVLLQAYAQVSVETAVEQMRLTAQQLRSRSSGYIQELYVWEAGAMPDSDPAVYRVLVHAVVRPRPATVGALTAVDEAAEAWSPVVVLAVESAVPSVRLDWLRSELATQLGRCGVKVAAEGDGPSMAAAVRVTDGGRGEGSRGQVEWRIVAEQADASAAEGEGTMQLALADLNEAACGTLSLAMAQESLRLWATPRRTTVTFAGLDDEAMGTLRNALGPAAQTYVGKGPSLVAHLAIAGNPTMAVESVLEQAGLGGRARLERASLTSLTYKLRPPAEAAREH